MCQTKIHQIRKKVTSNFPIETFFCMLYMWNEQKKPQKIIISFTKSKYYNTFARILTDPYIFIHKHTTHCNRLKISSEKNVYTSKKVICIFFLRICLRIDTHMHSPKLNWKKFDMTVSQFFVCCFVLLHFNLSRKIEAFQYFLILEYMYDW